MERQKPTRSIRSVAMDLLSRREHSAYELTQKLKQRDFDIDVIETALEQLQQDNLQNDDRYIESMVNHRVNAGVGPIKIRHELSQKGIRQELVEDYLSELSVEWEQIMEQQRRKRFGQAIPADYKEKMKQARFLQNRGFPPESVMRLFR